MPYRLSLRTLIVTALAAGVAPAYAADSAPQLTIYRDSNDALYSGNAQGPIESGYAMVNETRSLNLASGRQQLQLDDLPRLLDPQTLSVASSSAGWKLWSSQVLPPASNLAQALDGQQVEVIGDGGQSLGQGKLLQADAGLILQQANGQSLILNHYSAILSLGSIPLGETVRLDASSGHAGATPLTLSYATRGLGWRAVYQAELSASASCKLSLDAQASIANRSGRDWQASQIDLIAGTVNLNGDNGPRPLMMRSMALAKANVDGVATQSALDAYRRYRLASAISLPNQSISQIPLYPLQNFSCERSTQVDLGAQGGGGAHPWLAIYPLQPSPAAETHLDFVAPVNLPSGSIYVKTRDSDGVLQLLGTGSIDDTAEHEAVHLVLGQAFLLTAHQERVEAKLDRAQNRLDEQVRVKLDNAGSSPSEVQVIAHPQRWRNWSVLDASAPSKRDGADQLSFKVNVPAHGQTELTYTIRYQWEAADLGTGTD